MRKSSFLVAALLSAASVAASADGGRDVFTGADQYEYFWDAARSGQPLPSRTQVHAATLDAIARGDILPAEAGPALQLAQRCRAEVVAELHAAIRLGVDGGGEAGAPILTDAQRTQIADAGRKAAISECVMTASVAAR